MKRIFSSITVCLVLTFITIGVAAAATITLRADSWPPYNDEPNSAKPGYLIEIAELVFAAKGHKIDYQLMPWTRCLDSVRQGTYDAAVGTDKSESPDFVFSDEGLGYNASGFFVKKGNNWKYSGIDSLKQVRLGIIDGYGYFDQLTDYINDKANAKKLFAATGDDALPKLLKMLAAGRIDAIVENLNVMNLAIEEGGYKGAIVSAGDVEEKTMLYLGFSPAKESSKEYARILSDGIQELRQSGKLQEILSRYGLDDWK